jgi:tetratricopeptide (TPR) repeat protein
MAGPAMAGPAQAIVWFEAERAGLVAAIRQAAGRGWHDIAATIAVAMWAFFTRSPYLDDWLATSQQGVASARRLADAAALGWLLNSLGQVYCRLGQYDEAHASMTEALDLRRRSGDRKGEASVLSSLGKLLGDQGRISEALGYMRASLAIHAVVSERRMVGTGHHNVGYALLHLGRYEEALDHAARALAIRREVGDRFGEGMTGAEIADIYFALGRFEETIEHYRQARAAIEDCARDTLEHADVLCGLGAALAAQGRAAEAREALRTALPIADRFTGRRVTELRDRLAEALARLPAS